MSVAAGAVGWECISHLEKGGGMREEEGVQKDDDAPCRFLFYFIF